MGGDIAHEKCGTRGGAEVRIVERGDPGGDPGGDRAERGPGDTNRGVDGLGVTGPI
jgi:hypothetical protein